MSERILAHALYIDPPLGRVGTPEDEAMCMGRKLPVSKRPITRVCREIEKGETEDFMKVLADATTKEILGAAILGVGGDAAIAASARTLSRSETGSMPTSFPLT